MGYALCGFMVGLWLGGLMNGPRAAEIGCKAGTAMQQMLEDSQ